MINWIATIDRHDRHVLSLKKVTSHHLYYSMCSKCPPSARTQARRPWCHLPSAHSITMWLRAAPFVPFVADALFEFVDVQDLGMIDLLLISVKEVTDFQWFSGLTMIFWAGMRYPAWIHCCKHPKYNFCISQGSVATVLMLDGQNYDRLCHLSSRCCMPKIIKFGQCFTELFAK